MDEAVANRKRALARQMRKPRRRAGAAGAAVDRLVAVEHRIASVRAVMLRLVGPEDMADPANGGVERMDRLELRTHRFAHAVAEFDDTRRAQIVEAGVRALRLDDGVVVAAIGDVDGERANALHVHFDAARGDIGGDIGDPHRSDLCAFHFVSDLDGAGGHFHLQAARHRRLDQAMFETEGDDADGAVAAHRQAAAGLDEQDTDVVRGVDRRIEEPTRHHVMTARLEAQAGPDPVETRQEILPPLGHRGALQQRRPARHEADGVTCRMTVDAEESMPHRCSFRLPSERRAPRG
ncbi:hypothetical protein NRB_28610 [Novosphingobium sp. 11B]